MWEALAYFEVVLRNSMDMQLGQWNSLQSRVSGGVHGPDWCLDPAPSLSLLVQPDLAKATDRAQKALDAKHGVGTRLPTHDDVLAQTTLGLWRFLLPSNSKPSKQVLWGQCLQQAFPHCGRPSQMLVDSVHQVYKLRNRLAHLEPVFTLNLTAYYVNMKKVISEIDPDLGNWFTGVTNGLQAQIKTKPVFP